MNLTEFMDKVLTAQKEDWTINVCWGGGSGPSYYNNITVWKTGDDEFHSLDIDSHSTVASLKTDLSISLAWGMEHRDNFMEEWANKFPDPKATSSFIDFFYNGTLVYRDIYVTVDGGRVSIPLPDREIDDKTYEVTRYSIPKKKYELFKLINGSGSTYDYDNYIQRAGIEIVDDKWPK
ncbi:hypothetical protein [Aneurinibacillus migulanus]|uniref:Uncharacterized protein n=1 Tax=Aneurinibacillus migulanus TaxID=47500 RepID=A0A0D1Y7A1_ANEMI|nr:hypothetical protein [Aneurinibacillus migulanus]KIV60328.1 hypothetical protein TS65_00705 [Aneurinibacillus migulanus]KON90472.1 hypothetical protein AF333_28710 [Aneurinibacillus migulanus]MED0894963.1 hypothetical protein [Aneurinibacillus migulanus]MED1614394.1 hypothetical protein [Aneurinibacillus migulanus]SDJ79065.1 hypothetical protein SAMN04487909_12894 [Aneurinibacillus migulanus]